jgi:hypothetical protein
MTMNVTVNLTLTIDPEKWHLAYGTGTKAADVRADVKAHVLATVQGSAPVDEGGIREVTLR